jgi:threonylcarbamoyladenosine tRNA methylthiotransferase MtaB
VRVYLRTFGCRANQYDSEQVRALVEGAGGTIVDDPSDADTAVFNSCAVTAEAEVELRKEIRRAARRNARLRTVVMGCAAALDDGHLATLPTVSAVIPGGDAMGVAQSLGITPRPGSVALSQQGTRALLRIQEGCDEHCTFCATTLARGGNRSRPADALVEEATRLADRHPEIVLTGIHIGTWGQDIGGTLGALVRRLVREVPSVRFRLSSVEATEIDDTLRELFGEPARLAPHLHAPLQSGSDRVLRRMGRHWYTKATYARAVERIVRDQPVFGLGADVIAGFPGEGEEDHRETVAFVQSLPFTYLHVFPYSARPGTAATRLPGQLDRGVARGRSAELRAAGEDLALAHRKGRAGGIADVIVVRADRREGLTEDYLQVELDGPRLPRGTRLTARLAGESGRLIATPA